MAATNIEWTEHTWNPTTGCTKVSPGCKNCYAETMAARLQAMGAPGYANGFDVALHPYRLNQPLARRTPTTYFVDSMSDLFHSGIPDFYVDAVFEVMRNTPRHVYQVLTKRADRLPIYFKERTCPRNVWLGVSVEDRKYGVPRIDYLRGIDAPVRFLSIEPLLEDLGELNLAGIDWVIVGGELANKARPMSPEWAKRIQQQARAAGSAFFFKQWGSWGADGVRRTKSANGRLLNGRTWDEMPTPRIA